MGGMYRDFEIVHVIKPFLLIDAESYERVYWRNDGVALEVGYYVVYGRRTSGCIEFDEDALFNGPFAHRREAEAGCRRLRSALGAERDAPAPPGKDLHP